MQLQLENFLNSKLYLTHRGLDEPIDYNKARWTDYIINNDVVFSHRMVPYTYGFFEDEMHSHDFCELVFYISGDVHFVSGNKVYHPQYGDIFVAAPTEIHCARLDKTSVYNRYVLWFDTEFCKFLTEGNNHLAGFIFNKIKGEHNIITLPENALARVASLFNQIEFALTASYDGSNTMALSYLLQLLVTINTHSKNNIAIDRSVPLPECIIRATTYIEDNYKELDNISEIANYAHISREHLSRLFKQYYGTTVINYINEKRVNESKRLLELGANVTEACYASGFNNVSYYIKTFGQKVGVTPLEFKHSIKK